MCSPSNYINKENLVTFGKGFGWGTATALSGVTTVALGALAAGLIASALAGAGILLYVVITVNPAYIPLAIFSIIPDIFFFGALTYGVGCAAFKIAQLTAICGKHARDEFKKLGAEEAPASA